MVSDGRATRPAESRTSDRFLFFGELYYSCSVALDPRLKARLRRRIPAYLLLIGMMVIVLAVWRKGPSTVEVGYQLGAAREGLLEATMVYRKGQQDVARVRFTFSRKAAGARLTHQLKLPDGDYDVAIALRYRDSRMARMRRPLLVRGSGPVTVFVGER